MCFLDGKKVNSLHPFLLLQPLNHFRLDFESNWTYKTQMCVGRLTKHVFSHSLVFFPSFLFDHTP